jgi:hypothetical protein
MKAITAAFALFVLFFASCAKEEQEPVAVVFSASGDINAKLNEFRNQLGALNTTTGQTTGRREINWDGVPDDKTGIKLPQDFFNPVSAGSPAIMQRGLLYAGNADAMVSSRGFAEVNTQAAAEFTSFSGNKSFAVVNAALWPVEFRVAGETTLAAVKGFGIVFTDVDKANSTFLEFFNNNKSLGKYYVPAHDNSSTFSFLGIYFPDVAVTHVNIGHEGKLSDGEKDITQGGSKDLVVLDDFIYTEPQKQ